MIIVMFEYLVLESAQAGLSWYTILKKREGYRSYLLILTYSQESVKFTSDDVERLMLDAS